MLHIEVYTQEKELICIQNLADSDFVAFTKDQAPQVIEWIKEALAEIEGVSK